MVAARVLKPKKRQWGPPKNGSLRQAALACGQRQQAVSASPVSITQSVKKRPLPNSPSALSPSSLPPLSQRIMKDIQIGESEVASPEKEVLRTRSPPRLENSPSPFSPARRASLHLHLWSSPQPNQRDRV